MMNRIENARKNYISARADFEHIQRGMDEYDCICISNDFYKARDEYRKAIESGIADCKAQIEIFRLTKKFSSINAYKREILRLEMLKANI